MIAKGVRVTLGTDAAVFPHGRNAETERAFFVMKEGVVYRHDGLT